MENDYVNKLRNAIDNNINLSNEFKENIKLLTDALVTTLPNYNYDNYVSKLSNITIKNETIDDYSEYDTINNILKLNIDKICDERVDIQHLFLNEMLLIGNNAYNTDDSYKMLNKGISEVVSSLINSDEGKKINVIQYNEAAILSKLVDANVLLDSFMTQDYTNMFLDLEKKGISKDQMMNLIGEINKGDNNFVNTEIIMNDMYINMLNTKLSNNEITNENADSLFNNFKESLILNRSDLIILYPNNDFNSISDFNKLNEIVNNVNFKQEITELCK